MSASIHIENACLTYDAHAVFKNLNFTVQGGQLTCLLGSSGVGKTSLLRHIAGLHTPSETLKLTGDFTSEMNLKTHISYLSQHDASLPWLSAIDNVILGASLRRENLEGAREKAKALLYSVGLGHAITQYPQELSGGMRKRLGLARTLFEDKPIVLLDEPFASVDAITKIELQTLLCEKLKNKTVLLVTHDPIEALRMGDYIYVMSGNPATCDKAIELNTSPPRDLDNNKLLKLYTILMKKLTQANELTNYG